MQSFVGGYNEVGSEVGFAEGASVGFGVGSIVGTTQQGGSPPLEQVQGHPEHSLSPHPKPSTCASQTKKFRAQLPSH